MTGPAQLTFDLGREPGLPDETFIIAPGNAQAADSIARWPNWRSEALVLVGPEGSGKSHLARIWAKRSAALVLSASDIVKSSVPGLSRVAALVIEDLPDDDMDEAALFHVYNALRERGAALLLTSRSPVSAWRVGLPDLRSRLNTIPAVRIAAPDDALLSQMTLKLFSDRQIDVSPDVVAYVLRRMERSPDAVARLVDTADRLSLAAKRPITRNVVAEALRSLAEDAA